jgi:hypothetical protein
VIQPKYASVCAELAAELETERRLDAVIEEMLKDFAEYVPGWIREPPLWGRIADLSRENVRSVLRAIAAGGELPETCSTADARAAREAAESGNPVSLLLAGYHCGHRALWNAWSDLVDERGFDPELARELRRQGSDFFFAYAGRNGSLVQEEYAAARPAGTEALRMSVVRSLLAGEEVDTSLLDYPADGWHVGLVGSGPELSRRVREAAGDLDCRLLLIDIYEDPWWVWLGRTRPFPKAALGSIAELAISDGERLGIGGEARAAAGFRESNRQAMRAFRCTDEKRPRLTYRDVALEDLALRDRDGAAGFAETELGPISSSPRADQMLETLDAYFECDQNARATAKRLGVHHQTVSQRLDAVERLIGQPPAARRAELELALRLRRQLAAERV